MYGILREEAIIIKKIEEEKNAENIKDIQFDYYYDGDRYVVSINKGSNGFFYRIGKDKSVPWEYVIRGSLHWDSLHQDLYHSYHDFDTCPEIIAKSLPALPQIPECKLILKWKDNFLPLKSMPKEKYPELEKILQGNSEKCFWFILEEDLYETFFGDGKFLYFKGELYNTEEDAKLRLKKEEIDSKTREEPFKNHISIVVKMFKVKIVNDELIPINYEQNLYEHYRIEEVIDRIEEIFVSGGKIKWGEKHNK